MVLTIGGAPVPPSTGEKMKVKITGNCSVAGNSYAEGSEANLDKDVALEMIAIGRAIPLTSDRSVGLESSDAPAPKNADGKNENTDSWQSKRMQ